MYVESWMSVKWVSNELRINNQLFLTYLPLLYLPTFYFVTIFNHILHSTALKSSPSPSSYYTEYRRPQLSASSSTSTMQPRYRSPLKSLVMKPRLRVFFILKKPKSRVILNVKSDESVSHNVLFHITSMTS